MLLYVLNFPLQVSNKPSILAIDTKHGAQFYSAFYMLAFLVALIVLVAEGRRRKFPVIPWLLVVITSFLFFMVGTQAIRFSGEDWQRVFQFKELDHLSGRSVMGGILFGVPGLLLAKYILRFRYSLLDAFAFIAPVGMVIQRWGCLLAGCCYGKLTTMPWGIQYGAPSHAFNDHLHHNLVSDTDTLSLSIHPVVVYEIIGCLSIIFILYRVKKHVTVSGNLFLASLGLYGLVRFVTEFFRANSLGGSFMGITWVQLIILLLIPLIAILIIHREKQSKSEPVKVETPLSDRYALLYFLFISVTFLFVSRWLAPLEIVTLMFVMVPTLTYISARVFKYFTVPALRIATVSLMVGSFVMMSQTLPESITSDSTKYQYSIVSFGTLAGNSIFNYAQTDCNGTKAYSVDLENKYSMTGFGYNRVDHQGYGKVWQYGVDGYWGTHKEIVNDDTKINASVFGIHPYFQYDSRLIGVGFGLHMGDYTMLRMPHVDSLQSTPITTVRKLNVFPSAYFRVGPVNKFFGELKIAQQFPAPFPSMVFQTNIGFGFKKTYGAAIRIGTSSIAGLVLSPSIPMGRYVLFEPTIGGFASPLADILGNRQGNSDTDSKLKSSIFGSVNLRVKLGRDLSRVKL